MVTGAADTAGEIHINGLARSYAEGSQQRNVLQSLSATIDSGEAVALRGRSGSGKSTLLNLLCGIDRPDAGSVVIGGHDLTSMNERQRTLFRRRHIGFVYQAFNLLPTLTVADNLRLILDLNDVAGNDANTRIEQSLAAVGLAERRDSWPDVLSGGEQQRVALARALVHTPAVLLADEPTGNLDDRAAAGVLDLLDELRRASGATLVIATHSAAVAARCDRVLELRDGRLAGNGAH